MNLIIFDIDGTLLQTSEVDEACYTRAVTEVFGIAEVSGDWSVYEHCTDVAIASQLIRENLGRACVADDLDRLRERFLGLLKQAETGGERFLQTPGAQRLVSHLRCNGTAMCLATGGFEASARLKLAAAGLECDGTPSAFAEDGPSREQIIAAARTRAERQYGVARFDRIVSVGDGVWDVRTAAALGLPFVGIGRDGGAERLHAAGASTVLADFADLDAVLTSLANAPIPA